MSDYVATFKYEIGGKQVAVSFYKDNEGHEHFYKCLCPECPEIQPFDLRYNADIDCLCFSDNAPAELKEYAQQLENALYEHDGVSPVKDPFFEGLSLAEIKERWAKLKGGS